MERRTFLKLAGLGATAAAFPAAAVAALVHEPSAAAPVAAPVAAQAVAGRPTQPAPPTYSAALGSRLYRGQGSLVAVSTDGGRSWVRHSDFGSDVAVAALAAVGGTLRMTMRLGAREFRLVLMDGGRLWRTA